jgi:hypothetical protein
VLLPKKTNRVFDWFNHVMKRNLNFKGSSTFSTSIVEPEAALFVEAYGA